MTIHDASATHGTHERKDVPDLRKRRLAAQNRDWRRKQPKIPKQIQKFLIMTPDQFAGFSSLFDDSPEA